MGFSTEAIAGFTILFTGGCLILLFIWIFNHQRKKIIGMNNVATGTVIDVIQKAGMKGNKFFESLIQYVTNKGQEISVRHFNTGKSQAFVKGQQVQLFYDSSKPEKFVLKEDKRARSITIFFGTVGVLFIIGAVCVLLFL